MGDVQVAYTSSLHPGAKSAGKKEGCWALWDSVFIPQSNAA